LATAGLVVSAPVESGADALEGLVARGDRAYAARGLESQGRGRVRPGRIREAIAAYEEALAADPSNLETRWKTMAAVYYAGDFGGFDAVEAHAFFERSRALGEAGIAGVQERLGLSLAELEAEDVRAAVPAPLVADVGRLYFWTGVAWGAWARTQGLLNVATRGVAGKVRGSARVSLALDPTIERGGSQRLLAHLHANLPRVPFVSGWVDREKAVEYAEQALAVKADDLGNRAILGLVLLEVAPGRREEAVAILEAVLVATPRDALRVEDQATQEMVRERLEQEGRGARATPPRPGRKAARRLPAPTDFREVRRPG
jgi:tetratricopeptide (TPR) repeat protein